MTQNQILRHFSIFSAVKSTPEINDFIKSLEDPSDLMAIYFEILTITNHDIKEQILKHPNIRYNHIRKIVSHETNPKTKSLALRYLVEKSPLISNPDLGLILFINIFKLHLDLKILFNFLKITLFPFLICGLLFLISYPTDLFPLNKSIIFSLIGGLGFSNLLWYVEKKLNWFPLFDLSIFFILGVPLIILSLPLLIPAVFVYAVLSQTESFK